MLVWGGLFGVVCPPQVPWAWTLRVPLPFLGKLVETCAGHWYQISPFILQVTIWRLRDTEWSAQVTRVALQNPKWNLTAWFCIPNPFTHPYHLRCSRGYGLSRVPWGCLVTPLPACGISESCLGVMLIAHMSYSTHWILTCLWCLGHISNGYIFLLRK